MECRPDVLADKRYLLIFEGESHSKKGICFATTKKFQLLKCFLTQEISLQRSPKSDIDSHHFETNPQWPGQVRPLSVVSCSCTLAGSFFLSVFCVCVWKCRSALPLVVQIDRIKIQKNVLVSIDYRIETKSWQRKWSWTRGVYKTKT